MSDTPEGIGSLKFSLLRVDNVLQVHLGRTPLAALSIDGEAHMFLFITAPQLWDAANDILKALQSNSDAPALAARARLQNLVAKAAGKDRWEDVKQ